MSSRGSVQAQHLSKGVHHISKEFTASPRGSQHLQGVHHISSKGLGRLLISEGFKTSPKGFSTSSACLQRVQHALKGCSTSQRGSEHLQRCLGRLQRASACLQGVQHKLSVSPKVFTTSPRGSPHLQGVHRISKGLGRFSVKRCGQHPHLGGLTGEEEQTPPHEVTPPLAEHPRPSPSPPAPGHAAPSTTIPTPAPGTRSPIPTPQLHHGAETSPPGTTP